MGVKLFAVMVLAVALLAAPVTVAVVTTAPARADCGDPGQPACTGPVPTPDELAGLLNQLRPTPPPPTR